MNFLVHLIWTLILADFLGYTGTDMFYAVLFGVLLDLDHLIPFVKTYLNEKIIDQRGYDKRTGLQEPIFYLFVVPFSIIVGSYAPTIFFTLHLILDYMMDYPKYPLWPNKKVVLKGFVTSYGRVYWVMTGLSVLFGIVYLILV